MVVDGIATIVELQKAQHEMLRQLGKELGMEMRDLIEHAITSLWVEVQLKRAAARLK